jgi:hypothetical protein
VPAKRATARTLAAAVRNRSNSEHDKTLSRTAMAASICVARSRSPQRKPAPNARTARRMDDVAQAGLLARGSSLFSPLPRSCSAKHSGIVEARRRQLRAQLRHCLALIGETHRIPSWSINAIDTPELALLKVRSPLLSRRRTHLSPRFSFSATPAAAAMASASRLDQIGTDGARQRTLRLF